MPDLDAKLRPNRLAGTAGRGGVRAAPEPLAVLRNLDLVLLPIGVALALALGAPTFGVLVGAGGWLLQRALAVVDRVLIVKAAEPGSRLGLNFIDGVARILGLAGDVVLRR